MVLTSRRSLSTLVMAGSLLSGVALADDSVVASTAEQIRPMLVGSPVPDITLRTLDGSDFDLEAAVESKPTIVIFYRGGW